MHIVAIAWIYVVFMMSIAEHSVIAGIMTFLLYGMLPLSVILYLMGTNHRRRKRFKAQKTNEHSGAPPQDHDQSNTDRFTAASISTRKPDQ